MKYKLTIKDIKRAYKDTGYKPCSGAYYRKGECCPIGVLALANGAVSSKDNLYKREVKARKWASENIPNFTCFIRGFDNTFVDQARLCQLGQKMRKILCDT